MPRSRTITDSVTVRLFYLDVVPADSSRSTSNSPPTILLLHGFPQTSYQYRHVLRPLASAGFRLIVPDYRGAGKSPPPHVSASASYAKSTLAADLYSLITRHLGITNPIGIVGHDLGAMIAHSYATRYPSSVWAIVWGECPLPGTTPHNRDMASPSQFHCLFHQQLDLAEHLVRGNERIYLQHFLNKLAYNAGAITEHDLDEYVRAYSLPGRMREAMSLYQAFGVDKEENEERVAKEGKCKVPVSSAEWKREHPQERWGGDV